MLTSGQSLSPQKAKSMGLIHEIADPENLIAAAKAMIKDGLKPVQPWDEKGFKLPGGPVYSRGRRRTSGRRPSPSCGARRAAIIRPPRRS